MSRYVLLKRRVLGGAWHPFSISCLQRHARPFLLVDRDALTVEEAAARVREWLGTARPAVLNVAGPRESRTPGMYAYVRAVLEAVLPA